MQILYLLFARVDDINKMQYQIQATQELGARTMEQVIKDQAMLARHMEATGKAVAQVTLDRITEDRSDASFGEAEGFKKRHQPRQDGHQNQPPPHHGCPQLLTLLNIAF